MKKISIIIAITAAMVIGFGAVMINSYRDAGEHIKFPEACVSKGLETIRVSSVTNVSYPQKYIPVLGYHGFLPAEIKASDPAFSSNPCLDDIEGFELQMQYLHDNGWNTLSMDEFYRWHQGELALVGKSCVVTFDDGFYETYYQVYPVMKKYGIKGTCFIVGIYTPDVTPSYDPEVRAQIGWDKIKELQTEYPELEFESHSYNLHGYDAAGNEPWKTATQDQLDSDFAMNQSLYEFEYMAYPYGGYNDFMLEAVKKSGIKMAFAFKVPGYAQQSSPVYEIPRMKILGNTSHEEFVEILTKAL